jgi:hypothetical protein
VHPPGVSTGWGCGAASPEAQPLAEAFCARRRPPPPGLARVGAPALRPSVVDQGLEGQANPRAWWTPYGAQVVCPPQRHRKTPWAKPWRRWLAGGRPMVETVHDPLQPTFRLERERPQELRGLQAPWAATMAWQNFCIWLTEPRGRPQLAFTDLVDWSAHRISHQALKCPLRDAIIEPMRRDV